MKIGNYFRTDKRDDGTTFITLTDDRPDWLRDAVYEAHVSDPPNDWIYAECEASCDAIDEGEFEGEYPADAIHEYADSRVDIYTKDLYQWAADMCLTDTFAAAESDDDDMGASSDSDTTKRIMRLQYHAIVRIAHTMFSAYDEHKNDANESEEAS